MIASQSLPDMGYGGGDSRCSGRSSGRAYSRASSRDEIEGRRTARSNMRSAHSMKTPMLYKCAFLQTVERALPMPTATERRAAGHRPNAPTPRAAATCRPARSVALQLLEELRVASSALPELAAVLPRHDERGFSRLGS